MCSSDLVNVPTVAATGYPQIAPTLCGPSNATPSGALTASGPYAAGTRFTDTRLDPNNCGSCGLRTTALQNACNANGVCSNGQCAPRSCRDVFLAREALGLARTDGVYTLSENGTGTGLYQAYCDMANGGFTLVAKIDGGTNANWEYSSTRWTSNAAAEDFGAGMAGAVLDTSEGRFPSFRTVRFGDSSVAAGSSAFLQIRTRELTPMAAAGFGPARFLQITNTNVIGQTLLTAVTSGLNALPAPQAGGQRGQAFVAAPGTGANPTINAFWTSQYRAITMPVGCNNHGFNIRAGASTNARFRIGVLYNNEGDCQTSPQAGFGLGGQAVVQTAFSGAQVSNGYNVSGTIGTPPVALQNIRTFSLVFVR